MTKSGKRLIIKNKSHEYYICNLRAICVLLFLKLRLLRELLVEEFYGSFSVYIVSKLRIVHAEEYRIVSFKLLVKFVVVYV